MTLNYYAKITYLKLSLILKVNFCFTIKKKQPAINGLFINWVILTT